ncbi:SUMF1/EgtB/PvdO family nonheme iron enzyme [Chloroflexales bacterium ZM16-3]|nr:SUMF1/EgtB/PvdO family nonheme iron enzyme [Chloroflexales bacterium ZM16-3]
MSDIAARTAHIESMRPLIGDAAADAALAALRGEPPTVHQEMRAERIDQARQINATNYYETGEDPALAREGGALAGFLGRMRRECNALPLGQIDTADAAHRPMQLAQVYIRLNTSAQTPLSDAEIAALPAGSRPPARDGERPTRPLSAVEAFDRTEGGRLMLLGAPGSGKSTFTLHLAHCLAAAASADAAGQAEAAARALAEIPGWGRGPLLPVRVVLRDLAAFQPLLSAVQGTASHLLDFIGETLTSTGLAEARAPIEDALRAGRAALLLDGLDEVVGRPALERVGEAIADATESFGACQTLVTCRILDYEAEPLRHLPGFAPHALADLDDAQIDQFIAGWYAELAASGRRGPEHMREDTAALQQAIAARPELRALARLPLLLTVMALVHASRGALPDARALLYKECIDLLLLRWRQPRGAPDLLTRLGLPQFRSSDLLAIMARLGFLAHEQVHTDDEPRPADLSEVQVMALLAEEFARYDKERRYALAQTVLDALAGTNGLLLQRGPGIYAFPHRTFQEFLAGYHLKAQKDYQKLCRERAAQAHWHESLSLMVGYQVLEDRELERPIGLCRELLRRGPGEQALAGELLALIGAERVAQYDAELLGPGELWQQARDLLLALATEGQAPERPAPLRCRAGLALGQIAYGPVAGLIAGQSPSLPDPRLLNLASGDSPDGRYWCGVESGPFWHSPSPDPDKQQTASLVQMTLDYGFKIARFPVTNAEYAAFIAAGGYQERSWWTDEGWRYIEPGGQRWGSDEPERITLPRYWTNLEFNSPLQPVVGVSWYEAAAYCIWLTAEGHAAGWLPQDQEIRLPTSLEWEQAARSDGRRRYPWGDDEPDGERANFAPAKLGRTSPAGCFPRDLAPTGALDMAGNVCEWMATPYKKIGQHLPEKDFTAIAMVALSYGSWYASRLEQIFCGSRGRFDPDDGDNNWSFRVLWSPRST